MIRARAVALTVAALGLLSLVALASQRPLLRARTHAEARPSGNWTALLLALLALAGLVLLVYGITSGERDRRPRSQTAAWRIIGALTMVILIGLAVHYRHHNRAEAPAGPAPSSGLAPPTRPARTAPSPSSPGRQPGNTTWWEIAGLAAAAGLAVIAARFTRHPDAAGEDGAQPAHLVSLLDDSLEDLRRATDARRAVIATYARMERRVGATGVVRHPADTPLEYLGRIMAAHRVSEPAVARLTELFEQAKFSDHLIDDDIRREAIAALEAVRDELRRELRADVPAGDRPR